VGPGAGEGRGGGGGGVGNGGVDGAEVGTVIVEAANLRPHRKPGHRHRGHRHRFLPNATPVAPLAGPSGANGARGKAEAQASDFAREVRQRRRRATSR
jgi:hypothetical protein